MKKTTALIIATLLIATAAMAQQHFHSWTKMNETTGQDSWGNDVKICNWKCTDYTDNSTHTTQTQGSGFCPTPN